VLDLIKFCWGSKWGSADGSSPVGPGQRPLKGFRDRSTQKPQHFNTCNTVLFCIICSYKDYILLYIFVHNLLIVQLHACIPYWKRMAVELNHCKASLINDNNLWTTNSSHRIQFKTLHKGGLTIVSLCRDVWLTVTNAPRSECILVSVLAFGLLWTYATSAWWQNVRHAPFTVHDLTPTYHRPMWPGSHGIWHGPPTTLIRPYICVGFSRHIYTKLMVKLPVYNRV